MYRRITRLYADYGDAPSAVCSESPLFLWQTEESDSDRKGLCRLTVEKDGELLFDSGLVPDCGRLKVTAALAAEGAYVGRLVLFDEDGSPCDEKALPFLTAHGDTWQGVWLTSKHPFDDAVYFRHRFTPRAPLTRAILYVSGIGLAKAHINGRAVRSSFLDPAVSNYKKQCYYTVDLVDGLLSGGENELCIAVGTGWRRVPCFTGAVFDKEFGAVEFFGERALIAELHLYYTDGTRQIIATEPDSWEVSLGKIGKNTLFGGEVYDATASCAWEEVQAFEGELGALRAQTIEPVTVQRRASPVHTRRVGDGFVFDFGVNIAGVTEIRLPKELERGTRLVIEHAEELLPSGDLDKETLRHAAATDVYIHDGCASVWHPTFTYHGFRYAKVTGLPLPPGKDFITALSFYNNVENESYFRSGSPLANQLMEAVVQTERDNLHHLATDCPQRDERMGWMNDATVRFTFLPYPFRLARMLPKILDDILAEQSEDGAITCTAPRVYGYRPADPVCSSFLIAGLDLLCHYENTDALRRYFPAFKKWNECLKSLRNEEGIIQYTRYGDWAGPADCCTVYLDGAHSARTSSALMSTGYHYYNYQLLARFANVLGLTEERDEALREGEEVKAAFLRKWVHLPSGIVENGSQGAQAFALKIGILPDECRRKAARRLHEAVAEVGHRITTGNLNTLYLLEMLAEYGYIDDAWQIATREAYPSWGFMLQNGATTVWERWEDKRGSGMNSHCHPMYGAVGHWFYAYIAGVTPTDEGFRHFRVKPYVPEKLMYAECRVDTLRGAIYVRWEKRMGEGALLVDVPAGCLATVVTPDGIERTVSGGSHAFSFPV